MFDNLKVYFRYTSWPIIGAMMGLLCIGIAAIHVSEQAEGLDYYAIRQGMFALVALGAFVVATAIPYPRLGQGAYVLFGLTLILLLAVFLPTPLTGFRKGAYRWIGTEQFSIQPSEIAKITYIILLAWYLRYRDNFRRLRGLIVPFVLTLIPMALILKEPDLGTSLLFLPTLYFMLFMAGAKIRHLLLIVTFGTLAVLMPIPAAVDQDAFAAQKDRFAARHLGPVTFYGDNASLPWSRRPEMPVAYCRFQIGQGKVYDLQPLSVLQMKDYQMVRVKGWLRQDDPRIAKDKGFQLTQSKIVLGAGCLTGRSGWNDSNLYFSMLPEDHTDFIFSVIGGQWGFLGCVGVLILYGVIFVFGVEIAVITDDPFGRLLAVGVLALLFTQLVINAGMAMGLMPVTGMTLPLISYGGSSLVINCFALGLLVNVAQRTPPSLAPKPFEHGERRERSTLAD